MRDSPPPGAPDRTAVLLKKPGPQWSRFERELDARGVPLALQGRAAWVGALGERVWFVALLDVRGEPRCGFGVEATRSRALPGARILRASRFGHGISPDDLAAACASLADLAQRERALRLHVQLYAPEPEIRATLLEVLPRSGFARTPRPQSYEQTLLLDLRPSEEALLASFHGTCRRHIRAVEKRGLVCEPVTSPVLAARMNALLAESMARTGGRYAAVDWAAWIGFIADHPDLARLLGVFAPGQSGPDALLGFVLGCRHGDTVEYGVAASTRLPNASTPLLYAPTWDLMRWAKGVGATAFDFGGVTSGSSGDDDPRGGISDFKRYFSRQVVEVGGEFVLEPSRWRSAVASAVSAAAGPLRALRSVRLGGFRAHPTLQAGAA
jgi:hypothetical protein